MTMRCRLITFVLAETPEWRWGTPETARVFTKGAPRYADASIPRQSLLSQEALRVESWEGTLALKAYRPNVLLAEASFNLPSVFEHDTIPLREAAIGACREHLRVKGGRDVDDWSEEYAVYSVTHFEGDPEQFFKYRDRLVGLLKSEPSKLDAREIEHTLASQIKYARNDLVIVDWDGAWVFDPDGDVESTLELLELGNLQLLRYRLLDRYLDERLHRVARLVEQAPVKGQGVFTPSDISKAMKEIMLTRSVSITECQDVEREIKLIGDWYSARLYELITRKLKIDQWRRVVKEKLDALEGIYEIASERFTVSWERRARVIELVAWYVLLLGWGILLGFDLYMAAR
jgi:hypothetical protein